jgi:chromate reductase, NAD(P)H dehydrogenase (quinone)
MEVLGISGSLRRASYNWALLKAAAAACPAGVELKIWRGLHAIPAFNEDIEVSPPPVVAFTRALEQADAVLVATPEYNASVPGALKNALDWASRPFEANPLRNKPVAVIGASRGVFGAIWAQAELRKILGTIGACVDERELVVPRAHEAFTSQGELQDPGLAAALRATVASLIETRCQKVA